MMSDKKDRRWGRIPIRFSESADETETGEGKGENGLPVSESAPDSDAATEFQNSDEQADGFDTGRLSGWDTDQGPRDSADNEASGPVFAELLATRAELKRMALENDDLREKFARRQADFENFRKRVERERGETYNRATAELVTKLLPVLDNLGRALDTEASVEATESDEFRHFLSGVDLIYKQLGGLLESMGITVVPSVGEVFDPHVHEAVVTEESEQHEPDTVLQEIVRGYRLGDKLLRPALVKVAVRK